MKNKLRRNCLPSTVYLVISETIVFDKCDKSFMKFLNSTWAKHSRNFKKIIKVLRTFVDKQSWGLEKSQSRRDEKFHRAAYARCFWSLLQRPEEPATWLHLSWLALLVTVTRHYACPKTRGVMFPLHGSPISSSLLNATPTIFELYFSTQKNIYAKLDDPVARAGCLRGNL